MNTVANSISIEKKENEMALELAMRILSASIYRDPNLASFSLSNSTGLRSTEVYEKYTTHNVAMHLKDVAQNLSGYLFQSWQD